MDATSQADDGRMFCYRHPDRETYIRCGRCDRPICARCAMQGPVGFRCKKCGTLAYDPLTSFRPTQLVLGFAVATGGGIILGLLSGPLGWLSIVIAFFGGGIISQTVTRVTGYKRGPIMLGLVLGGIVAGMLIGDAMSFAYFASQFAAIPPDSGVDVREVAIAGYLFSTLPWLLISVGAAWFGAYSRLR